VSTPAVVGIDIGTRSVKVLLVAEDGEVLAHRAVDHDVSMPHPGWHEHDARRDWWDGVREGIAGVLADRPDADVRSVGLSACGPCLVVVGADGMPLRPALLYGVDTRAEAETAELAAEWPEAAAVEAFGMPFTTQSVAPKLRWLGRHEPDVTAASALVLTANGWLGFRLTGRGAIDHHQAAYFAPFYRDGAWDEAAAGEWAGSLPDLAWSDERIGEVTLAAAEATGLPAGIPVVLGSSDGVTDAIGAGVRGEGAGVIRYGSTIGVTVLTDRLRGRAGLWATPGYRAGQTMLIGGLSAAGAITTWFREEFARELPQGASAEIIAAHDLLTREAEAAPLGAGGVLVLPYFAGERTPFSDPGARGVILGAGLDTSRGDLYRAVLEGTALGVRTMLDAIRAAGVEVTALRAVGGGTARSLWMQLVSDATGLPQERATPHWGAPFGAAVLAAHVIGLATDAWTGSADPIAPSPEGRAHFDAVAPAFTRLYRATRDIVHDVRALALQEGTPAR
jgi:xylulokinase